jgi:hypothetical protein
MAGWEQGKWDQAGGSPAGVPLRLSGSGGRGRPGTRLDGVLVELYDEAMARFDAFCFWYARPPRSLAGMREVAKRLEAYGSPEALRIAEEVRAALAEG